MPRRQDAGPDEALPKLTIGQRILAALPNLQRDAPRRPSPGRRTSPSDASDTAADGAVKPDAVLSADTRTVGGRLSAGSARRAASSSASSSASSRSSARVSRKADVYSSMSVAELQHALKFLDDRERRWALQAGPLIAALDIAIMIVTLMQNPPVHHKYHADPTTILFFGIGTALIGALVVVAAAFRRRSFTLFALLISGLGAAPWTLIPAWGVAGWIFVHFNRIQKTLVAKQGGAAATRQARAKARNDRLSQRGRQRRDSKTPPLPAGPPASKRYTPPKEIRPRTTGK